MPEKLRIDDPYGHGGLYSKIERIWKDLPAGFSLRVKRTERFDPSAHLLYSPVEYFAEDISSLQPENLPNDDWVIDAFSGFVHGEFGREVQRPMPDAFGPLEVVNDAADDTPERYLERCESELVYGGILRGLDFRRLPSIHDGIYEVLTSPLLGNPANRRFLDKERFAKDINPSLQQHNRLQFILPGFPFKDQNIFRTESPPEHVDLGDIALLIRLHTLALAFFQIHPFGADWIILADGTAYSKALGIEPAQAVSYRENLREKRNRLNLQGTVTILDLLEVAKSTDGTSYKGRFEYHTQQISSILKRLVDSNERIRESFDVLTRGMSWNLATRQYIKRFSRREIWYAVTNYHPDVAGTNDPLAIEIRERSREAALYYGAFNLALRWHQIPQCLFPTTLRTTVHPKLGQIAVPSLGPVYPWNGIPIVHQGNFRANDISTHPWCEIRTEGRELVGHAQRVEFPPLYYTLLGKSNNSDGKERY